MNNANNCRICGNSSNNKVYKVKEMQLGLRERFDYLNCGNCGCMQLLNIPDDFSRYYPNQAYYSFTPPVTFPGRADRLRKIKADHLIHGRQPILGKLLSIGYKKPEYYNWLKIPGVEWEDRILDVGCGNGSLLLQLFKIGFTNLTGIDPFINEEKKYGKIRILKKDVYQVDGVYDYIMLNHSFEHMNEPLQVMLRLKDLLAPQKNMLIRTPLMNMYGWKKFGLDWVALDAPRHIFVHTIKSMQILAEKAGLEIKHVVFDTNPLDFIISEQYQKDIALLEPPSFYFHQKDADSKKKVREAKRLAKKVDAQKQGDQASFYLHKP